MCLGYACCAIAAFVMSHRPFMSLGTIVTVVLVLALWGGALLLPGPTQEEPLRVAVGMWPGTEPWILAREAGELDSRQINLVEMNWTSAAMRAVGNRVVDAAVLSLDEVIRQIHQGYPLKIVMVTDISRGADMLMTREGINSIADLKGCRIGYEPRTSGAWLLSQILRDANLHPSEVQQVPLNPAEVEEIFKTLSLDGVVLAEPWRHRMAGLNLKKIYDSSEPEAAIVRVLAVHPEAVEAHREVLVSLIKEHLQWMPRLSQGGDILKPILRREGVSMEVFQDVLKQLEGVDLSKNRKMLTQEEPWLANLFRELQKDLVEDKHSAPSIEPADVFDPSLLEEIP